MAKQRTLQKDFGEPNPSTAKEGTLLSLDGADLGDRLTLIERFNRKPGVNGDIQNAAEATRMIANPDFEIAGTNASSDDSSFDAEGGVQLQTDGADGDEVILQPHTDANQSQWEQTTFGTDQESRFECFLKLGASVANYIVWAGLKLTNTEVIATDADQVFFRLEDDVNSGNWEAVSSIGGTDTQADTGVAGAVSTGFHLAIEIDADRIARFYIDGVLVHTTAALTDATDFTPYIGVAADGAAAAKEITVRWLKCSRKYA